VPYVLNNLFGLRKIRVKPGKLSGTDERGKFHGYRLHQLHESVVLSIRPRLKILDGYSSKKQKTFCYRTVNPKYMPTIINWISSMNKIVSDRALKGSRV
jgi:hypothetical protein